jgi:hypothetical protein
MSNKKLYRATYSGVIYFVAADAIDAERCVEDYIREEIKQNGSASVEIEEATKCFEAGWVLAIPWGENDDKQVVDYLIDLKETQAAKAEAELQDSLHVNMDLEGTDDD